MHDILSFYAPTVKDPQGGFRQNFLDDGTPYDDASKHLVSSCRMVFNFCEADRLFGEPGFRNLWQHGLEFIRAVHWQEDRGGYVWSFNGDSIDETNHCYGLAFVMLTHAACLARGDEQSKDDLYRTWTILEGRFWLADVGLYADEISADWQQVSTYRGQNANMHMCEALMAAFDATNDTQFLDRAYLLARKIAVEQSALSDGLVWEHFKQDLSLDMEYNRADPRNLYRPWGFQPGHQTEWSKLLLLLYKRRPEAWMLQRAQELFDRALKIAWDDVHGGIFYGFDPDENICDLDKYFWVQAESFAAAALLATASGDARYWDWYDRIWEYCWQHFVDHKHGAWFRLLTAANEKVSERKSLAGAKCDYHTIGACITVLDRMPGA